MNEEYPHSDKEVIILKSQTTTENQTHDFIIIMPTINNIWGFS